MWVSVHAASYQVRSFFCETRMSVISFLHEFVRARRSQAWCGSSPHTDQRRDSQESASCLVVARISARPTGDALQSRLRLGL